MTLIPPFNHRDVIAGQGTAAKELFEEVPDLDYLFVCLGGGGLLSGSLLAAGQLAPRCKVYGVEPQAGDDARQSLRAGQIVQIPTPHTIADGAQTQSIGDITFAIIREHVEDILAVADEHLVQAMRFYAERKKIVVEPTGALSLAGAPHGGGAPSGAPLGLPVNRGHGGPAPPPPLLPPLNPPPCPARASATSACTATPRRCSPSSTTSRCPPRWKSATCWSSIPCWPRATRPPPPWRASSS